MRLKVTTEKDYVTDTLIGLELGDDALELQVTHIKADCGGKFITIVLTDKTAIAPILVPSPSES